MAHEIVVNDLEPLTPTMNVITGKVEYIGATENQSNVYYASAEYLTSAQYAAEQCEWLAENSFYCNSFPKIVRDF